MTDATMDKPVPMTKAEIATFFEVLAGCINPVPELHYQSNLDLLIAVVLSAQCTDKAVNKATVDLFPRCRTPQDYVELGEEALGEAIRSIGLWRNKAKAIVGICTALIERHNSQVPDRREALQALPGVGRKTANVVLNIAFGQPTLAVDTHIFRVANRTGMVRAATPEKTEEALLKVVPATYLHDAHHYLILHGRYTCIARRPKCPTCPVAHCCHHLDKTSA